MTDEDKIRTVLESCGYHEPSRDDFLMVRIHIQNEVQFITREATFTGHLLRQVGSENKFGIDSFIRLMMADDMDYVNAYLTMKGLHGT